MKKILLFISALLPFFCGAQSLSYEKVNSEIKKLYAPDSRQAVWEVSFKKSGNSLVAYGQTSEAKAHVAFKELMRNNNINYIDSINVYPENQWALVRISVASLRGGAKHSAEIVTQALMGTPLRLLERKGEWWRVQSPDGYISYVPVSSLQKLTIDEMKSWRSANRLIVKSLPQIRVYNSPEATSVRDIVTDLVNGCIVEGVVSDDSKIKVKLPDGRVGWVCASDVEDIHDWANQKFNAEKILETAYSMMGTPYLWGGMSTKALDCSGLARVSYFANGIILMRDASQQAKTGMRIEPENWRQCKAGDLLYFGNAKTKRVTHVAIYDHDGRYIHSSGRVKVNSVDPQDELYLTTPFLSAIRVDGQEGTKGITRVANHKWYFN